MDDRLISLNAALKELENLNIASFYELNEHSKEVYTEVKAMLKALPPEVIVPVRQGRWIVHHEKLTFLTGEASSGGVLCSKCGWKTHNKMHVLLGCPFKYCPNCGADMRKDGDGNE